MLQSNINVAVCTKSQKEAISQLIKERGDYSVTSVCISENPLRVRIGMFALPSFHYELYIGKRGKIYEWAWGDM